MECSKRVPGSAVLCCDTIPPVLVLVLEAIARRSRTCAVQDTREWRAGAKIHAKTLSEEPCRCCGSSAMQTTATKSSWYQTLVKRKQDTFGPMLPSHLLQSAAKRAADLFSHGVLETCPG